MSDATTIRPGWRARGHAGWWAFAVHRVTGVALALFLPLHFWFLARALQGPDALDAMLRWTDDPWVKASEVALVLLLAVHLAGGLRLLVAEFGVWRASWQPAMIAAGGAVALALALAFALNLY